MMDMMTIILVFLLKSYQTDDVSVAPFRRPPDPAVQRRRRRRSSRSTWWSPGRTSSSTASGSSIVDAAASPTRRARRSSPIPADEKRGQLVSKLYDVLLEKAETAKDLGARVPDRTSFDFKGEILLQVDKRMPFSVVREVMFTAGQAQFGNFRFVVIKGGG